MDAEKKNHRSVYFLFRADERRVLIRFQVKARKLQLQNATVKVESQIRSRGFDIFHEPESTLSSVFISDSALKLILQILQAARTHPLACPYSSQPIYWLLPTLTYYIQAAMPGGSLPVCSHVS